MEFITKSISQKGCFHDVNEDSYVVNDNYIVIADGMGGESCGDIASKLATSTISTILNHHLSKVSSEKDIKNLTIQAFKEADSKIIKYVGDNPDSFGMGTTVVLIIMKEQRGYVAWCGDSRCYIYSKHNLQSITKDHSYVQELIDKNEISIEDSFLHPDNNIITKFVGGGDDICIPEFVSFNLNHINAILLCSDGLSGYCNNKDIEYEISLSETDELPSRLLQLAIKNGSDDDITIVTMVPRKRKTSVWNWFGYKN